MTIVAQELFLTQNRALFCTNNKNKNWISACEEYTLNICDIDNCIE